MARMNEKAEKHLMMVVPKGATVVVVRASAILAGISLALAFLAILTSTGLGKPHVGLAWERVFWGGAVVSALLAFGIQLRSRGRVVLWWPADLFSATPSAAMAKDKRPLRFQYTTRGLFAFVTASALLVVFFSLPDDFQELIVVLAVLLPAVGCFFFVAFAPHIGGRHAALLVIAMLQLIAMAMLFGPFRSWFWR
jgi:hypothetical protein